MRPGQPRLHPRVGRRGGHGAETGRGISFASPFPPKSSFPPRFLHLFYPICNYFPPKGGFGVGVSQHGFFFHAEGVPGKGPPRLRASPPVPARSSAAPAPLRSGQTKGSAGAAEPFNPSLPPHRHPIAFLTAFNLLFLFILLLDLHLFFFFSSF